MFKIGEFSKLCKVSTQTLRYYNSEGIFCPDKIDNSSGYRYYSSDKLVEYNRLLALKEIGFTLDEIKLLNQTNNAQDNIALIERKRADLIHQKINIEKYLNQLNDIQTLYFNYNKFDYPIIIKGAIEFCVSSERQIFKTYIEAKEKMLLSRATLDSKLFLVNYEMEYKETDLDIEIGFECSKPLKKIEIPEPNLSIFCKPDDIETAYSCLYRYIEKNNYQIIGESVEIYYDIDNVEIRVPINYLSRENCVIKFKQLDRQNINHSFENDEDVIGKWELVDIISSREQFNVAQSKNTEDCIFKYLYFLPNGNYYWVFSWSKGILYRIHTGYNIIIENYYTVDMINNQHYMFIRWIDKECVEHSAKPKLWVFRKTDNKKYTEYETRIKDKTNYKFISDEKVIGKWKVIDFVYSPENFNLYKPITERAELSTLFIEFQPDGACFKTIRIINGTHIWSYSYTKNKVINYEEELAEKYFIKEIDNRKILFVENKSGDYYYGGQKPLWYVFSQD